MKMRMKKKTTKENAESYGQALRRVMARGGTEELREHQLCPLSLQVVIHLIECLANEVNPEPTRLDEVERAASQTGRVRL